ncbi:MAG: discoidin domain-containing protein [Clostridia bacterium]|nr:discoidin domain-containing protein [Clostridia bacterium]
MKKLSFILSLILVISCLLVACGDEAETNSEAIESESVSVEESADASADESVAESTPAEESTEESESIAVSDVNLALGKSYTISDLYRRGEGDGYDPEAPAAFPDEDDKSLTDGKAAPEYSDFTVVEWVGFNGQAPTYTGYHWITLDLGEKTDLAKFVFKYGTSALQAGIVAPFTIEIYVSDDGENWGEAIASDVPPEDDFDVNGIYEATVLASGRYVQYRFTSSGWAFISEVEAYGIGR